MSTERGPRAARSTGRAGVDDIATVQLPSMERIRAFVVVAEELHFGRAAARLHLTQPPLSRQIMLLEQEVGVSLLDRGGRVVKVTPAGRVFLAEARRILRLAEESTLAVRRIPTGTGGTLVIGFTAVSVHGYVRSFLRRAGEELPHVDLVLRELVTAGQVEAIASGDLDLGFVRPPVIRAGLVSRVVHAERLLLAAPADDPFATRGQPADVADLDGRALVMYSPVESRYFYELLLGMTVRAQARPRYVQYVSQVHTMLALVQAGVGLAVIPESATALHPDGVAFVDLADGQSPPVELAAAWRADTDNAALTRALGLLPGDDGPALPPARIDRHAWSCRFVTGCGPRASAGRVPCCGARPGRCAGRAGGPGLAVVVAKRGRRHRRRAAGRVRRARPRLAASTWTGSWRPTRRADPAGRTGRAPRPRGAAPGQ